MLRRLTATSLALAFCTTAWAEGKPPCDNRDAIWANKTEKEKQIFYFAGERSGPYSPVIIEEWRGDKLAWRQNGLFTCSNGASTCYVMMEVNGAGSPVENTANEAGTPEADAVFESIDENDDGLSEWVILAGLRQSTYYANGAKTEWSNGFSPDEPGDRIPPANIYRFESCRSGS
jgi:hypothetical protein